MWRTLLRIINGKSLASVLVYDPSMSFPIFTFNNVFIPLSNICTHSYGKQGKGKTITLKMALNCVKLTFDEKRCLDLSLKELSTVPKCIEKMCNVEELNLSRNHIKKIPDFINLFTAMRALDLHSNYVSIIENSLSQTGKIVLDSKCYKHLDIKETQFMFMYILKP